MYKKLNIKHVQLLSSSSFCQYFKNVNTYNFAPNKKSPIPITIGMRLFTNYEVLLTKTCTSIQNQKTFPHYKKKIFGLGHCMNCKFFLVFG